MQTSSIETNPFASPRFIPVETLEPQGAKSGRASEQELKRLCKRLVVAEVSYLAGSATFVSQFFFTNYSHDIQTAAMFVPFACFIVTWISMVGIHRRTEGVVGAIAAFLVFPIPLLGTLTFLSGIQQSKTFLVHNGYQKTFLGGKPNLEERQRMAIDENYYPSACFDRQGNRHKRVNFTSLSYILVPLLILCLVALAADWL